jgi:hypothetical protein
MTAPIGVEEYLQGFKEANGEEAWKAEITRLARQGIQTSPKHAAFWKRLTADFEWLDWEALEATAGEGVTPDLMMAEILKRQMPGIQSQAQYDAVAGALDAARLVLNGILEGKADQEAESRRALETAFEAVKAATTATRRLEEVPEAATSEASKAFKEEPAQFTELEDQRRLLAELDAITGQAALTDWYNATKPRRDKVVTQSLRNELLDAIRAKKNTL